MNLNITYVKFKIFLKDLFNQFMLKEYIFISDGYRGGANTFMNNHMEYLISKKKKVFLYDQNPNFTFEKLNKKISTFRVEF